MSDSGMNAEDLVAMLRETIVIGAERIERAIAVVPALAERLAVLTAAIDGLTTEVERQASRLAELAGEWRMTT